MAFNADEYIGVIVEQIGGNFQELHDAIGNCEKFQKTHKEYLEFDMNNGDVEKFVELHDKYSLQKKSIGNLVCNYDVYKTIEPLSVGLFGEWGSGKTHLLKLIEQQVIHLQYEKKVFPQTTIPVFFNAWRFEKEEHLIIPLFQTLLASIENFDSKHFDENVKKQLGRTKERLKILSFALAKGFQVPKNIKTTVATLMTGDLTAIADFIDTDKVAKAFKEGDEKAFVTEKSLTELLKSDRIESIYMNIPQWIEKITIVDNINFVFLIDDLDRCLPENTLKMLESIKLFLDVPSCAFVLAIDDDVVERGVAYHYRDYLQQNNNIIINLDKKEEEKQEQKVTELPITGHEYLEKMIQLPFRIPVIGTDNVYEFLEERYRKIFETILKENELNKENTTREHKEMAELKAQQSQTDMILDFFAKTIPPKPRKLKRTAMLFETKVRLLEALKIELRPKLIAKITLLELFAPKLLRFIQNNDYARMYDRLVHFRSVTTKKGEEEEKSQLSLADVEEIRKHIDSTEAQYTTKEKEIYHKLMDIVTESRNSRMVFDLDAIFDTSETKENLQLNIEMMKPKEKKAKATVAKFTYLSESSIEKLFRPNDSASWADAFRDNKALVDGEALLSDSELDEVIRLAKEKEEFAKDPEWMGIVATYISDEQYIHLLKELYEYRFADINGKFKMGIYQVTFAEYDRYCQVKGFEKVNDNEWGRGKRPIMRVNWEDATAYAKWLSGELEVEYKLPKEDDWYLACNGEKKTKWHFGDNEKELKEYAWYDENSDGKTHPVGELKPNALGLYDMHGNIWEWCEDWYEKEEKNKVLRGGSWDFYSNSTRSASRDWVDPTSRFSFVGFRLLRTLP